MKRSEITGLCAAAAATVVASFAGAGAASAATKGTEIGGANNGNCTATITEINHTNSTNYQPDWWFEQENDVALVNATQLPASMPTPWRAVNGIPWPIARWVGTESPYLTSGLAPGILPWGSGNPYNGSAQPEGFVTERTIDLKTAVDAPPASADGTKTIWFRIRTGPQTADRAPTPQQLVVTGCEETPGGGSTSGSSGGGSSIGSFDLGTLFN
ncbi:hypothetical protein BH683_012610 [Williamsia sp. 1138]|nr:hypothetical protein [Williamsia sp. 1138]OZG28911.1 hypothetical protein BH683_012610 [Williamsia sp. 1138]